MKQPKLSADFIRQVPHDARLVAAVSGGGDSVALAILLAQSGYKNVTSVTVDHGLRGAESAAEALQVGRWMKARNIPHKILTYKGPVPKSDIQARARQIRYDLLCGFCQEIKADFLIVAHTMEDQAETFLIRLARGSGLYGLAGINPFSTMNQVEIARPLLDVPRQELRDFLRKIGQEWVEDPSNNNTKYTRVKMRNLLPVLAENGITVARITLAVKHLQRVKASISKQICDIDIQCKEDEALIPLEKLVCDREIGMKIMAETIKNIGSAKYTPRFESVTSLYDSIISGQCKRRTLGGCIISLRPVKKLVSIKPEIK